MVQKARELRGALAEADADAREKAEEERAVRERAERQQKEREGILRKESALLLAQFDHLSTRGEPQERGYLLQLAAQRLL